MSRNARAQYAIVAVAAILIALLAAGMIANMEKVERTVRTPPEGAARDNPLLAAERLLGELGREVRSDTRLEELPPVDHLLVLAAERRVLTRARADRIIDWVQEGGYLIIGPYLQGGRPVAETENDLLLAAFGVGVEEYDLEPGDDSRAVVTMDSFTRDEETYEVEYYAEFALTVIGDENEDGGAYALIWNDFGEGRVAVINDLRFLRSDLLGEYDHARFLWDLVLFGGERAGILLIHGWGDDTLWTLIGRHAWPGLLVGTLLLLVWFWRHALRFGPLIPVTPPGSRALLEHIDGLGYFLWRSGRGDALVENTRQALERRMLDRCPGFGSMSGSGQVERLAVGTDLTETAIEDAWSRTNPRRRDSFTRTIRTLERLRREL